MKNKNSIRAVSDNAPLNEGEKKLTVQEIMGIVESNRLGVYRAKDNFTTALNAIMQNVDMLMQSLGAAEKSNEELEKKYDVLQAKYDKLKKKK